MNFFEWLLEYVNLSFTSSYIHTKSFLLHILINDDPYHYFVYLMKKFTFKSMNLFPEKSRAKNADRICTLYSQKSKNIFQMAEKAK